MLARRTAFLRICLAILTVAVSWTIATGASAQAVTCPSGIGPGATCSCSGTTLTIVEPPFPTTTVSNASACATPTTTTNQTPIPGANGEESDRSRLEQDLRDRARDRAEQRVLDEFEDKLWEFLEDGDKFDEAVEDAAAEEDEEVTDEDKNAQLAEYRALLREEQGHLRDGIANLSDLRQELPTLEAAVLSTTQAHKEAEANAAQLNGVKLRAEKRLSDLRAFDTDLNAAQRDLDAANADVAKWRRIVDNFGKGTLTAAEAMEVVNRGITAGAARNYLSAALAKKQLAEQNIRNAEAKFADAEQAVAEATANHTEAANAASQAGNAVEGAINRRQRQLQNISVQEYRNESSRGRIAEYKRLIALLEAESQFAGPSAGPFDALRARGVEVFGSTGFTRSRDKQLGRNQEGKTYSASAGVQARLSERVVAGVSFNYGHADTDDKTGVGTSSESNTYTIAPFAAYLMDEGLALGASLYYGYTDSDLNRAGIATASYGTHSYGAAVSLNARHRLSQWMTLNGSIRQSVSHTKNDGYTDSAGLSIAGSSETNGTSALAGRLDIFPAENWRLFTGTRLTYLTNKRPGNLDRLDATVTGGIEHNWGDAALLAQVDHLAFRNNLTSTGVSVQLRVPW